jgi:hypothetical protein
MRRFALLTALALLATACKVVPASPEDPATTGTRDAATARALGDTVRIDVRHSASWDAGRFVVTFDTVEADSRCPADAMCVWQGDAAAGFHLSADGRRAGTTLHTATEPKQVEYAGYELRLVNVEPYPGTYDRSKPAPAPVAVVVVTRP